MRSLVTLFLFFMLIISIGIIIISGELQVSEAQADGAPEFKFGQVVFPTNTTTTTNSPSSDYEVDRDDDPQEILACSEAPDDCSLRSAVVKANEDGNPSKITFQGHRWIRLTRALPPIVDGNTTIKAAADQEVHIDGNNISGNVFRIIGAHTGINGLRIYGAGSGFANVVVTESAFGIIIANNIIGDGDGPAGNCGSSENSYGGIYVDAQGIVGDTARAWIFGNTIECHNGFPGEGISVLTDKVFIGVDNHGQSGVAQQNHIRHNRGFGINLNRSSGNTVSSNILTGNQAGGLYANNLNNNLMYNVFN